jgi:hypothetical protein
MTTPAEARECLDDLDDFARMSVGVVANGALGAIEEFITQYEKLLAAMTDIAMSNRTKINMKQVARQALGWDPHKK